MERIEHASFVGQMPRSSVEQVRYRDAVEDHQALLNEPWSSYCVRRGYAPFRADEEHVKWVTETWSQYEDRVIVRDSYLTKYFGLQKEKNAKDDAERQTMQTASKNLIAKLLDNERRHKERLMKSMHTLYVDFDERQAEKMRVERLSVEENETMNRNAVKGAEAAARKDFELLFARALEELLELLEKRRIEKEEEERRLLEEQRRKAEEMRLLEEARRREAEAADKAAREAEEEAKRAERKRREEERKQKAKAEREARARQVKAEQENVDVPAPEVAPEAKSIKPEPEPVVPPKEAEVVRAIEIVPLSFASTLTDLFAAGTQSIKSAWESCYIIRVSGDSALVVAHNGEVVGKKKGVHSTILGKKLGQPSCVSLSSTKLHSREALPAYERSELIHNVKDDPRCFPFAGGDKSVETLLMVPCLPSLGGGYIIAVSKSGAESIDELNAKAIASYVESQIGPQLERLLHQQRVSVLAKQAIEWLSITTCCKNCYLAISDNEKSTQVLTFTSATPNQQFLIGKTLTRKDEDSSKMGVSFALIDESIKTGQPEVAHISDVMDESTNKVNGQPLAFLGEKKKGSLLLCPIYRPSQPNQGQAFGVVYADTMNDEKTFNKADEDMIRTTAVLLAELLDKDSAPPTSAVQLAIEKELLGEGADSVNSPIRFLKHIWLRVNTDISMITSGQLLELAKYNHPPPIIPITIAATLLVALGSSPKSVENWEDARKKIKTSLVEKIVAFDPTDPAKRKKAFFIRSRKITANYSAHDVFTRGSYPASCFFTWTYVTILLRRSADALRKATKAAGVDGVPVELLSGEAEEGELEAQPEQEEEIEEDAKAAGNEDD